MKSQRRRHRCCLKRVLLFVLCCSATAGWAAENTSTPSFSRKLPKCCVWRVTNAKAPVYLVGSLHSLSASDYPLPSPYELALNSSERLVFEYDPNKNDEFQKKLTIAGRYPPGQDIRNRINPRTLSWLRNNTQYVDTEY